MPLLAAVQVAVVGSGPSDLAAERNSQQVVAAQRRLIVAFLTFLPHRTAAIKASSHSTEAVAPHIIPPAR